MYNRHIGYTSRAGIVHYGYSIVLTVSYDRLDMYHSNVSHTTVHAINCV